MVSEGTDAAVGDMGHVQRQPAWWHKYWSLAALMLATFVPAILPGQVAGTGTVTGHVRGPGGVAVPGASVLLVGTQTGERKETWTDADGNYTLAGVNPGTYKLEVSLVGFRPDVREPVPVTAGKTLRVNVALVLALPEDSGAATAQARKQGSGNLQQFPEAMRSRAGNSGEEGDGLAGGAQGEGAVRFSETSGQGNATPGESPGEETDLSASAANSFLLSGGTGASAAMPGEGRMRFRERMEEFRMMMGGPGGPGFGGGPGMGGPGMGGPGGGGPGFGGRMMMGGRGGWAGRRAQVNRIRGNIMESYSNSVLDAHPYPLNVAKSPQIPAYTQRAGFSLGGPLVIPKIYNGSDKTSWFVSYNNQRSKNPFDSLGTVPTSAEREGNFSQAVIPSGPLAGSVPVIYQPPTTADAPRVPFDGNQIPSTMFDKAAVGLLPYIPLPNLPGSVQNFHLQESLPSSSDRVMARIGQQLSKKDSLNAFYFFNSSRSQGVGNFPGLTRNTSVRSQNLNLSETHTFGPGMINTLLANFNRQRSSTLNPFAFQDNVAGNLGIQGISTSPFDWGLPIIQFTNFTGLNDTIPSLTRNQTLRLFDFVIWNAGKHNFRFGGEVRRVQLNTLTDPDARGTFTFSGYTTSDFANGLPVAGTGYDFADFLLGLPQTTSVRFGTSSNYLRSWVYSGFFQDDWRAASHVTFNLGLRYEYFTPFVEKYGHLADLSFGPGFTDASVVTGQNPGSQPASLIHSDANNFAPRFGLAYRPWIKHNFVLRAGYGIFYDGSIYNRLVPNLANQPPFAQASTLTTTAQNVLTLQDGFPYLSPNILRNTYAVDSNFRAPYAQTWNFTAEDEIFRNVILTVGYLGTKGSKLDLLLAPTEFAPGTAATGQGLALNNALAFIYETSGASSIYNGLRVGLRRQFHGGLSIFGEYTYSKSIDDAASVGGSGRSVAQDWRDLQAERALSAFDMRHRLLVRDMYELPFGERRRWLNRGGPLARVIGNWQISGITTIQSGNPYTAQAQGNLSNFGGAVAISNLRADATGLPVSLPSSQRTTSGFFNTDAFTLPPAGQYGNAGRNTIPGPGRVIFNMSLDRFVTLSRERRIRADFRVEARNIFNTPNFGGLATVVNAQDFGRITSVGSMRSLNFTLRLRF
jgi:hypothetical protein